MTKNNEWKDSLYWLMEKINECEDPEVLKEIALDLLLKISPEDIQAIYEREINNERRS